MKFVLFFTLIIASANVFAQQAPHAVEKQVPQHHTMAAPRAPRILADETPNQPPTNNTELLDLLRAQTTAIKSLSNKLDVLEERIRKIEGGSR